MNFLTHLSCVMRIDLLPMPVDWLKVSALYEFIRDRLADTSVDFQLFTTPPRVNLSNMSHSLIEAQLFPMAIVHMTTRNGSPKARDILRPDVLEAINTKSAAQANEITSKWMARKASS
uniref:UBX domain-containing protein n=1 Tax=Mesocestoides corti TaxID=53468 RepID=A0A5K3EL04_MESCO